MKYAVTSFCRPADTRSKHAIGQAMDLVAYPPGKQGWGVSTTNLEPFGIPGIGWTISDKAVYLFGALVLLRSFPTKGMLVAWPENRHYHMTDDLTYGWEGWKPCSQVPQPLKRIGSVCMSHVRKTSREQLERELTQALVNQLTYENKTSYLKLLGEYYSDIARESPLETIAAAALSDTTDLRLINFTIQSNVRTCAGGLFTKKDLYSFLGKIGGENREKPLADIGNAALVIAGIALLLSLTSSREN
jgi:hypothetical protein